MICGLKIRPSRLRGTFSLPPSKSHTLRACFFAALASGTSTILSPLISPDVSAALRALRLLGAMVEKKQDRLIVHGTQSVGKRLCGNFLDVGNSGLAYRFATALCAHSSDPVCIDGDASLRHLRPIWPLAEALIPYGAKFTFLQRPGYAPFLLHGPIRPGSYRVEGPDSQPLSSLLMSLPFLPGTSSIYARNVKEKPWVAMTESWLRFCSINVQKVDESHFEVSGSQRVSSFAKRIPKDMSALAFPLAAALITHSEVTIDGVDETQGDFCIVEIFRRMGAHIEGEGTTLRVGGPQHLRGLEIHIDDAVDALPILAVVATCCSSPTRLYGGRSCRHKESDRIATMARQLCRLGARVQEHADGLTIFPSSLSGAALVSEDDHRVAMALTVAGLVARGHTCVAQTACISKSFPQFFSTFQRAGASIETWV